MTKISIIIPVYNLEQYLSRCIDSVLNQIYTNLELLLINDGSTDKSGAICDAYAEKDKRVRVFHKKNGGVSSARNIGLKNARGEWITFIDGDDAVETNYYSEWNNLIENNNSDIYLFSHKPGNGEFKQMTSQEVLNELIRFNIVPSLWLGIYKREIFKDNNLYLNENIHFFEDYEFLFRIIMHSKRVALYDYCFYNYNQRLGSANHMQISDKVMSCLLIADSLQKNKVSMKKSDIDNIRLRFMSQAAFYYLKTEKPTIKITKQLQQHNRKYVKLIITSKNVLLKTRIILLFSTLSTNLLHKILSKKYRNHLMKNDVLIA